jgi:hypothetical protein
MKKIIYIVISALILAIVYFIWQWLKKPSNPAKYTTYEQQIAAIVILIEKTKDWYAWVQQKATKENKSVQVVIVQTARKAFDKKGIDYVLAHSSEWNNWI